MPELIDIPNRRTIHINKRTKDKSDSTNIPPKLQRALLATHFLPISTANAIRRIHLGVN